MAPPDARGRPSTAVGPSASAAASGTAGASAAAGPSAPSAAAGATGATSTGATTPTLAPAAAEDLLRTGRLEVLGRLVAASNVTLLCRISGETPTEGGTGSEPGVRCIYKPTAGEAPLWDFPPGTLARREVAARLVSEASGWGIVPPTILRDGPYGPGMVQLWLEVDPAVDIVELVRAGAPVLRPIALFDAVVNNADRKAGHLLPLPDGRVCGVDHGVCFSPDPKLRTVLWAWMDAPLADEELAVLRLLRAALDGALGAGLAELLAAEEVAATARRIERLLETGRFPVPDPRWPAIPWPWY